MIRSGSTIDHAVFFYDPSPRKPYVYRDDRGTWWVRAGLHLTPCRTWRTAYDVALALGREVSR